MNNENKPRSIDDIIGRIVLFPQFQNALQHAPVALIPPDIYSSRHLTLAGDSSYFDRSEDAKFIPDSVV
jgi:hypothetical protein